MPFYIDPSSNCVVRLERHEAGPQLRVIDGETAATCRLVDGQAVTPDQITALLDGSISAYRLALPDTERAMFDQGRATPVQPAVTGARPTRLTNATYMNSHPRCHVTVEHIDLDFDAQRVVASVYGEPFLDLPWTTIRSISADSRESIERRITATRVVLLGALALFATKQTVVSYLVITDDQGEWIFAIPKMTSVELHAWTQPWRANAASAQPSLPPPTLVPIPSGAPTVDDLEHRLRTLDTLLERGVITSAEHGQRRAQILSEI